MNNSTTYRRSPLGLFPDQPAPRLYDRVVEVLRTKHYSRRTEGVVRARKPKRLPTVLTPEEVDVVLDQLDGVPCLVCNLQYGGGLRVLEALQLRVKDLDFGRGETMLRDVKGRVDHVTMLPEVLHQPLQDHLRLVREQHEADLALGLGRAPLPYALARKYPHADREWAWQWIFPASSYYLDRQTGLQHRQIGRAHV